MEIVDHFSKFCQAFLLQSKNGLEVFSKIKYFIEQYGTPNYLVTDNGTEFKNKILKSYCLEKNKIYTRIII